MPAGEAMMDLEAMFRSHPATICMVRHGVWSTTWSERAVQVRGARHACETWRRQGTASAVPCTSSGSALAAGPIPFPPIQTQFSTVCTVLQRHTLHAAPRPHAHHESAHGHKHDGHEAASDHVAHMGALEALCASACKQSRTGVHGASGEHKLVRRPAHSSILFHMQKVEGLR